MGRFSPTVRPTSAPSGLAQALQSGVAGFQRERDRMEGQMDRQRKRVIETDTLASQGLVPNLPETPETFGSAFSRALSGAPEPEPQRAVVPGGFVIDASDFEKVDPRTGQPSRVMRLPSGGTYDPSVMEGRLAGTTMAKGLAGNQVQANNRGMLRDEYGQAVVENGGTLAGAGSQGVIDSFLRKQPSTLKVLGANAGNPAGVADAETGTFTPLKGSNAVPRATGTAGAGGRVAVKVQQDLKDIDFGLQGIERAIGLVESNPDAFGLKNLLGPTIVDRMDPEGIQARTAVENIVSTIRHALYGAALTRPEIQRALTNLPDVRNDPKGAVTRLRELAIMLTQERGAIERSIGDTNAMQDSPTSSTTPPAGDLVSEFERRFPRKP